MKLALLALLVSFSSFSMIFAFDSEYFTKYDGYTVYKVIVKNENDLKVLEMIEKKLKNG